MDFQVNQRNDKKHRRQIKDKTQSTPSLKESPRGMDWQK